MMLKFYVSVCETKGHRITLRALQNNILFKMMQSFLANSHNSIRLNNNPIETQSSLKRYLLCSGKLLKHETKDACLRQAQR